MMMMTWGGNHNPWDKYKYVFMSKADILIQDIRT